jgi:serine/threonine protein phosphatase PrpC
VKGLLQPTRVFGDFYLKDADYNFKKLANFGKPYLTHQPEINSIRYYPLLMKRLILGSDGLWEELNIDEIYQIVMDNKGKKRIP